jgi:hypothetical protein
MTAARTAAARLRGAFVGATSASVAVAAHSAGGGVLPSGATLVMLVLSCATVGAAAAAHRTWGGPATVLTFVVAGQLVGHCVLVMASGHMHGGHWSLPMLAAHAVAALVCAALICTAERLYAAAVGELHRLILAVLDVADDEHAAHPPVAPSTALISRILVRSGLGTRAPPASAFLA